MTDVLSSGSGSASASGQEAHCSSASVSTPETNTHETSTDTNYSISDNNNTITDVDADADAHALVPSSQDKILLVTRKVDSLLDLICKPFEQITGTATSCPASITTAAEVDTALQLLLKIVGNIIDNPHIEKYRSINTTGKMYKEKLVRVLGVQRLLHAIGFQMTKQQGADGSSGTTTTTTLQLRSDVLTGELPAEVLCVLLETRGKVLSIVECRKIMMTTMAYS